MTYFVEGLTTIREGESTVRTVGQFETLENAVRAAQQVIDEFLSRKFVIGMTAAVLFANYHKYGEVPYIFSDDDRTMKVRGFNHLNYATDRCAVLVAGKYRCVSSEVPPCAAAVPHLPRARRRFRARCSRDRRVAKPPRSGR